MHAEPLLSSVLDRHRRIGAANTCALMRDTQAAKPPMPSKNTAACLTSSAGNRSQASRFNEGGSTLGCRGLLCHSWFHRFRKLLVRYEKLRRSFIALNHLTAAVIALRKVTADVGIIYG